MTTVAWDGKTLAADSRGTAGGLPMNNLKTYKLADGRLFAAAGVAEDAVAVLHWLNDQSQKKPEVKDFTGILIDRAGLCFRLEDKLLPFQILDPFHAVGSGRDFAIAAMHLGKTAREAVELAMIYDVYTGGTITEVRLDGD